MSTSIGLLHPGEMGAGIGGSLVREGHEVLFVPRDRSSESLARARLAGMTAVEDLDALRARASVIISIVPPHAALEVAKTVAGYPGLFVDANAISPALAVQIEASIVEAGGSFVDAGIIGGAPPKSHPQLYLSGQRAEEVSGLFHRDEVTPRVMEGAGFAASAMKMCYAAWTKATAALLLDVRALSERLEVSGFLLDEWARSSPELLPALERAAVQARDRGWRWAGEMQEIANTFEQAKLPAGFHEAAKEIFSRIPRGEVSDHPVEQAISAICKDDVVEPHAMPEEGLALA